MQVELVIRPKRCPCGTTWEGPVLKAFAPPEGEVITARCARCVDADANWLRELQRNAPRKKKPKPVKADQMKFPPTETDEVI